MTTHRYRRCRHCSIVYRYQSSGEDSFSSMNDYDYCRDCKMVILEALKPVPSRVEKFFEYVSDQDEIAAVLSKLEEVRANPPRFMGMAVREQHTGLHDLKTGSVEVIEVVRLKGAEYRVGTWTKNDRPRTVRRTMERDLRTGHVRPWEDFNDG